MSKKLKLILVIIIVALLGWLVFLISKNFFSKSSLTYNNMILTSSAFSNNKAIPEKYGCHGQNINPPLSIQAVPAEAKSLVLIVDDPDSPSGDWSHWLIWNLDPKLTAITENSVPTNSIQGLNDFGNINYGGPCPHNGTHHYQFKLYALDNILDLKSGANKSALIDAMSGHILAQALLVGTYSYK